MKFWAIVWKTHFTTKQKTGEKENGQNLYKNTKILKNIMNTFYHQKGQVLKKCFGHHLLLLRMIIYSTPVLGAPVISLPEKKDFKVGFEENSNLARSRAKVPGAFL